MGYKTARSSFDEAEGSNDKKDFEVSRMIPRVLHYSISALSTTDKQQGATPTPTTDKQQEGKLQCCWALIEYVGPDEDGLLIRCLKPAPNENLVDALCDCRNNFDIVGVQDTTYLKGMIKTRKEFGFEEPHPRWGRVPVDQALRYARTVLYEVMLPLHRYSRRVRQLQQQQEDPYLNVTTAHTYSGMVQIYRQAWMDMTSKISPKVDEKHEQWQRGGKEYTVSTTRNFAGDFRIEECLRRLQRGLRVLGEIIDSNNEIIPSLAPVLVHMDLQPQNLIFLCTRPRTRQQAFGGPDDEEEKRPSDHSHHTEPAVFSVLDWEDAAWADPRFDLILLCRKVCANRDQANILWSNYARSLTTMSKDNDGDGGSGNDSSSTDKGCSNTSSIRSKPDGSTKKSSQLKLGPIEPWLRLETIHSITAMLMQSMNFLQGGRSPWESKHDLWGKLQREFSRLDGYGDQRTMSKKQQKFNSN